jgi:hypothetical protein
MVKSRGLLVTSLTSLLAITLSQSLNYPAQAATNWLQKVKGTYEGQIWSGGSLLPTTTNFIFNSDGSVTGSYEADEGGLLIPGTISDCKPVKGRTITCIWDDFYGQGRATFTFDAKFSRFDGHWTGDKTNNKFPWRGYR